MSETWQNRDEIIEARSSGNRRNPTNTTRRLSLSWKALWERFVRNHLLTDTRGIAAVNAYFEPSIQQRKLQATGSLRELSERSNDSFIHNPGRTHTAREKSERESEKFSGKRENISELFSFSVAHCLPLTEREVEQVLCSSAIRTHKNWKKGRKQVKNRASLVHNQWKIENKLKVQSRSCVNQSTALLLTSDCEYFPIECEKGMEVILLEEKRKWLDRG